ncbi:hypothetical protein GPJ56_003749 [Histomonas meleagridis]|uniref:uncharacterized protein n=1 Tax=Histomonas meleagridis TaxID=135588 RepID=UPI003559A551|nr:hypothetical protein GPJ56_003749 [Histomonas meleagridis]KAH0805207.1 hypothetical protein GO595_002152 [Histomonas meleagridis]
MPVLYLIIKKLSGYDQQCISEDSIIFFSLSVKGTKKSSFSLDHNKRNIDFSDELLEIPVTADTEIVTLGFWCEDSQNNRKWLALIQFPVSVFPKNGVCNVNLKMWLIEGTLLCEQPKVKLYFHLSKEAKNPFKANKKEFNTNGYLEYRQTKVDENGYYILPQGQLSSHRNPPNVPKPSRKRSNTNQNYLQYTPSTPEGAKRAARAAMLQVDKEYWEVLANKDFVEVACQQLQNEAVGQYDLG